jgi:hypothetical protein
VGVMLTSFGTFFAGEGLGVRWWNSDWVLLFLIAGYAAASLILVQYLRQRPTLRIDQTAPLRMLRAAVLEVWGLFVTDGLLAIFTVAGLLFVVVFIERLGGDRTNAGLVLAAGVVLALGVALLRAARATARKAARTEAKVPDASRPG